jgi:hypothetical protein
MSEETSVGSHWLIVVPYYFVGTLAVLPMLIVLCRLVRLKVPINALVGAAIVLTLAGIIIPLAAGLVSLTAFTGRPMLILIVLSFVFAAVDAALHERLPLPLDHDLQEL